MIWPFGTDTTPPRSELERLMQALDWSRTPVGPVATWPHSLKVSVRILLDCQLPMYLAWGPGFTQFYNDAYRAILGNKHPQALGTDARTTWSEIWPAVGRMWAEVLAGHPIGFDDYKLTIDRYGYLEDCYFNFSYSPVTDDGGLNAGVLVTFAETTEKVLASRRRAFLLQLADAIRGLADPADVSKLAAQQLGIHLGADHAGYGEIEQAGLAHFDRAVIDHLRAGRTLAIDDAANDPRTTGTPPGDARALLVAPLIKSGRLAAVLYVHSHKPRHWSGEDIAVVEDVAERTWDAIERARAQEALRSADRRKDEFLAMLAHELRNPLAPVYSAAQLLKQGKLTPARTQQASELIERQVDHMSKLVDDLLDVSRVTRGLVELAQEDVDLGAVIDTALEQARPLANARGHRLVVQAPADRVILRGDRVRLIQVLSNLLNNAAKYTLHPGTISVAVRTCAHEVEVVVEDDGAGIGPELLPNIFDLFVQGRRLPDRPQGGLGLGLALVKTLVELHGGTISAHSDGSSGSRFTIHLPWVRAAGATTTTAAPPAAPVPGLQIMLVDDNQDAALMLSMLLEAQGHTLKVAHDGGSALTLAQDFRPHALILDIGLPDMDGFQLARKLRQREELKSACFIALTGYGQQQDRAQSQAAGFDIHLTKPANHLELARVLARIAPG